MDEEVALETGLKPVRIRVFQARRAVTIVVLVVLALLPTLRIVYTLGVIGEDNLSNDAGPLLSRFLTPVLRGSYNWLDFPRDTFINTHSNIFPGLVFILLASVAHLEVHAILYLGVLLALVRLWLLKDVAVRCCGPTSVVERGAVWLMLAGLVFSISQMSIYEFPLLTIKYGLSNLGTALGVWGMVRFRDRMAGVWLVAIAAVVATWSNATGFALWPAFLIGMWLLGFRRIQYMLVLAGAAVLSLLPYLLFLFVNRSPNPSSTVVSLFNPIGILNILGRPFANNIGTDFGRLAMAEVAASIGLILCGLGGVIFWAERARWPIQSVAPVITLIAAGLMTSCEISLFRSQVSPWYTGVVMDFWIGLASLAFVLWHENSKETGKRASWMRGDRARTWSVAAVAIIAVLYVCSNITRADKSFYIYSRSPVSAACLRHYQTAPTYCECSLVRWLPGNPAYMPMLGRPLQENHLSVFSQSQEWSLQGDSILGNVAYAQAPGAADIYWAAGIGGEPAPFTDYRKLDLVLAPANSVSWTVDLPLNLEHAEFQSAVAAFFGSSSLTLSRVSCEVSLHWDGEPEKTVYSRMLGPKDCWWNSFRLPLGGYAGRTVTIRLSVEDQEAASGAGVMFQYPSIGLLLKGVGGQEQDLGPVVPSNTDLSPRFTRTTPDDYLFDLQDAGLWSTGGIRRHRGEPIAVWSKANADSALRYDGPLSVPFGDYSQLYMRVTASEDVLPRALLVTFSFDGKSGAGDERLAVIPLLADPALHGYTLDLRLLDRPSLSRLTGLSLQPLGAGLTRGNPLIQISDLRFIRRSPAN